MCTRSLARGSIIRFSLSRSIHTRHRGITLPSGLPARRFILPAAWESPNETFGNLRGSELISAARRRTTDSESSVRESFQSRETSIPNFPLLDPFQPVGLIDYSNEKTSKTFLVQRIFSSAFPVCLCPPRKQSLENANDGYLLFSNLFPSLPRGKILALSFVRPF